MKEWADIYLEDIIANHGSIDNYFKRSFYDERMSDRKLRQFNMIKDSALIGRPILEVGCGLASLATYFAKLGYDIHGIDNDKRQLDLATRNSMVFSPDNPVKLLHGDMFNLPYENKSMGLAFSNGVLEHFSDDEIIHLINEQLRVSEKVAFGVPSTWYERYPKMRGDERYLERDKWRDIIQKSKAKIISEPFLGHTKEIRIDQEKLPPEERIESFLGFVLQEK